MAGKWVTISSLDNSNWERNQYILIADNFPSKNSEVEQNEPHNRTFSSPRDETYLDTKRCEKRARESSLSSKTEMVEKKPRFENIQNETFDNQDYLPPVKYSETETIECSLTTNVKIETEKIKEVESNAKETPSKSVDKEKTSCLTHSKIKRLAEKEPIDVVVKLLFVEDNFHNTLLQEMERDTMAYILIVLGKLCIAGKNHSFIYTFINRVISNPYFMIISIQKFMAAFERFENEAYHFSSLTYFLNFLKYFQRYQPSSAADFLLISLPLLKCTYQKAFPEGEMQVDVISKLEEIEKEHMLFLNKFTHNEILLNSAKERSHYKHSPKNFRCISILPNKSDLEHHVDFLRPNIVRGRYIDVEHYLDVQFRLLREDYVRPLREGIAEYLKSKKRGASLKWYNDVRFYENVNIIKSDFEYGRLVHTAQFHSKMFKRIRWKYSKRFLTGSLLCITSDDFHTMRFASVARRVTEDLRKGLLAVRFEDEIDVVPNLNASTNLVVVETDAYFEAYRYNLAALQDLSETTLSMQRYIVEVEKTVRKPEYLTLSTNYDMRPLLSPLNVSSIGCGEEKMQCDFSKQLLSNMQSVAVLNDECWPTADEIGLDESQYAAVKSAITKEFSVIQGPPGTGKTYVGLRIIQLLLHNQDKWQPIDGSSPILIVCYTNHALDQFLEGVLLFTNRIVRIGGQGTNKALADFHLNHLKQQVIDKKELPHYIFSKIRQRNFNMHNVKRSIERVKRAIEKCYESVLREDLLREYMGVKDQDHYDSLTKDLRRLGNVYAADYHIIYHWLKIPAKSPDASSNFSDSEKGYDSESCKTRFNKSGITKSYMDDIDNIESEGEVDVEHLEAQRNIDTEKYDNYYYEDSEKESDAKEAEAQEIDITKTYIQQNLMHHDRMREEEARLVYDVWLLSLDNRWRLYKFWLHRYIKAKESEMSRMQERLKEENEFLLQMRAEEDYYVLQNAFVVGMTTTGASKYRSMVQRLNPCIVIVEEAAEILESHIVTSLAPNTQHVILIGDHQQLQPSPTVHSLAVKFDLNVSLFERMIKNGMECHRLSVQHRMRPEIASLLVPHIYTSLENHESVMNFENIKGIEKNVFFVSHSFTEVKESDSKSRVNEHEAKFLIRLSKYLILQGYDPSQITILTTYSGQLFALRRLATETLKKVRITVVDNFQGEENDIILVSFVRSNEDGIIGFLNVSNRVCVALSRAKKGLYCIGNFELLAEQSNLWKNIVATLNQQKAFGKLLPLVCQNHPDVSISVAAEEDFDAAPEGGCHQLCEYRLECGHTCPLYCHPYDLLHEEVVCEKPCVRTVCENQHPCDRKCNEDCGECQEIVSKLLQNCLHTVDVQCSLFNSETKCTKNCERILPCGHKCTNKCRDSCTRQCKKYVSLPSPICGHTVQVQCFNAKNLDSYTSNCEEPCGAELQCGHICSGTCSKCYQGRFHIVCGQRCNRILVCGHECKALCSKSCPPCNRKCENRCKHNKCALKCGEPCIKCTEPCDWSCKHKKCTKLCGELCDRKPCARSCKQKLKCNHRCIGLCGEPCPTLCRICDEKVVTETFFGSEDEKNAKFVLLEDCGHIFEVRKLTVWMEMGERSAIQLKTCPRCKTVIRRNQQFGNIIKTCLDRIEKVKTVTFGDVKKNNEMQQSLLNRIEKVKVKGFGTLSLLEPLINNLMVGKKKSIQEITTLENVLHIALEFMNVTESLSIDSVQINNGCDQSVKDNMQKVLKFLKMTMKLIQSFIQTKYLAASEQQMLEILSEIQRLKFGCSFLNLVDGCLLLKCDESFMHIVQNLTQYSSFCSPEESNIETHLEQLAETLGRASTVINIPASEKKSILKAMALARGHWYQCPNGHVYCITECGGAMQVGRCNECMADIGGSNHKLLPSNRVASDMEGEVSKQVFSFSS